VINAQVQSRVPLPAAALVEAAEWFVLLASGDVSDVDRQRWLDWRSADPAHEQAWQRAHAASERFATIPRSGVRAALSALAQKSRLPRKIFAPLVLLATIGIAGWQAYWSSDFSADAVAAIGEQREIRLPDGSRLVLDTNSAIDIEFSAAERLVHLRRGRIMIETAHRPADRDRPFRVAIDEGRVTALGTRFTVEQSAQGARVVVLEARVRIDAGGPFDGGHLVDAGHTAHFTREDFEQSASSSTDGSWSRGMLVANDLGLCDFLAELSRYRVDAITCDASAASLHISGAFPLRDTNRVLAALGDTLPIQVQKESRSGKPADIVRAKHADHPH
jgi:transmembrane sensor